MSSKAKPKKFCGKFFRMKVDLDKIKKLPPDIKKDFMKLYLKHAEKKKIEKINVDFLSFVKHVWPDFI